MEQIRFIVILLSITIISGIWNGTKAQKTETESEEPLKLTSGYEFTEGPYWHKEGYLLFSDIPANIIYKWTPGSQESEVFLKPSGHSNGITADSQGRLVIAQHDGKVSRIEENNNLTVLADSYEGKRFNSPNDLTISTNGIIYFTDPPFGVSENEKELKINGVYSLTPGGKLTLLYDEFEQPNGIVLSPDENRLYVNDTATGQIIVLHRKTDGNFSAPRTFASVGSSSDTGAADGMVVDENGRLYSTGPGGIYIFSTEGKQVSHVEMPARVTNMDWGGQNLQTLYLTTPSAIYSLKMDSKGIKK